MSNEVTQSNSNLKPKRKTGYWFAGLVVVLFVVISGYFYAYRDNPIYEGKRVSEWFEEAVQLSLNSPYFLSAPFEPRIINAGDGEKPVQTAMFDPTALEISQDPQYQVFLEIEGDAIRYLMAWLDAEPSKFSEHYKEFYDKLPKGITSRIPEPKDVTFYGPRNRMALRLLTMIGMEQRRKAEIGKPSSKTSIAVAIPQLRALLKNPSSQLFSHSGPRGSQYYSLIDYGLDYSQVITSLGRIGPESAPAVPELIEVLKTPDAWRPGKDIGGDSWNSELAIRSLGNMRLNAYPAVELLSPLLRNFNQPETFPGYALEALARIGVTPDETVPQLKILDQSDDEWIAILATVALWNRDLENVEYQKRIIAFLQTERRDWLLTILNSLGKNPASLTDEIRRIANNPDSDPQTVHLAKAILRNCELPLP